MEINWTQIILNGISTGVGACFGTIGTFIVMRYFPKIWVTIEKTVKSGIKINGKIPIREEANVKEPG